MNLTDDLKNLTKIIDGYRMVRRELKEVLKHLNISISEEK